MIRLHGCSCDGLQRFDCCGGVDADYAVALAMGYSESIVAAGINCSGGDIDAKMMVALMVATAMGCSGDWLVLMLIMSV